MAGGYEELTPLLLRAKKQFHDVLGSFLDQLAKFEAGTSGLASGLEFRIKCRGEGERWTKWIQAPVRREPGGKAPDVVDWTPPVSTLFETNGSLDRVVLKNAEGKKIQFRRKE